MSILTILLTAILVMDCCFLILLVLVQLPKKEAGAGVAFGGGATDALFGAGSGTALTKITKYAAGVFFVLAILLAMLSGKANKKATLEEKLKARSTQTLPMGSTPPSAPATMPTTRSAPPTAAPAAQTPTPLITPVEAPAGTTPPSTAAPAPAVPATTTAPENNNAATPK